MKYTTVIGQKFWALSLGLLCFSFLFGTSALADETINMAASINASPAFGRTGDIEKFALKFVPSADAGSLTVHAVVVYDSSATHLDDIRVTVESDSFGTPANDDLGHYDIDGTTLHQGGCDIAYSVDFPVSGLTLTNGTTYYLVFSRVGSLQTSPDVPDLCTNTSGTNSQYLYSGTWYGADTYYGDAYGSIDLVTGGGGVGGGGTSSSTTSTVSVSSTDVTPLVVLSLMGIYFLSLFGGWYLLKPNHFR